MPLAPFASDPQASRGREFPLENALTRGPRSAYQRDRDRIIHSIAFRRLRYKTQVFIAPDGDHYRVRLTHSLEVAQIARVIALVPEEKRSRLRSIHNLDRIAMYGIPADQPATLEYFMLDYVKHLEGHLRQIFADYQPITLR